jgi:hypothetical protein
LDTINILIPSWPGEKESLAGIKLKIAEIRRRKNIFKKKPINIDLDYSIPINVVTDREGAS